MENSLVRLCECGCGQPAPIATRSYSKRGIKKGDPFRFIAGHNIAKPTEKVIRKCGYCGKEKELYPSDAKRFRFCSRQCQGRYTRELTTKPEGAKYKDHYGYIWIKKPDCPMSVENGFVREHRYIASQKLGRMLTKDEEVHHINGIKNDNRLENLQVLTKAEHRRLHNNFNN